MNELFKKQIESKSTEELLSIYKNPGEYQEAFVSLASMELQNRNVELGVLSQELEERKRTIKEEMNFERPGNDFYIALCFISAFLGGLLGIIGGMIYSKSKKTDPFGEQHYVYDEATRKKGRLITVIGTIMLILAILWKAGLLSNESD